MWIVKNMDSTPPNALIYKTNTDARVKPTPTDTLTTQKSVRLVRAAYDEFACIRGW